MTHVWAGLVAPVQHLIFDSVTQTVFTFQVSGSLGHVRRVNCTIEAMGRYARQADR
jgi:hypothetical protein